MNALKLLLLIVVLGIALMVPAAPAQALVYPPPCSAQNDGEYFPDPETGIGYWCDGGSGQFKDANGTPHPFYPATHGGGSHGGGGGSGECDGPCLCITH